MGLGMVRRVLLVLLAVALAALPQAPPQGRGGGRGKGGPAGRGGRGRGPDPAIEAAKQIQPPEVMQLVAPDLYLVINRGGNVLFKATPEGVIVVDTKLPGNGNFERLMEYIRGVSREPVKYVFNTHHHQDHTGNNAQFLALGAEVVAPVELKERLAAYAADPKPAAPNVTFEGERTVMLGGVEVRAYHFAAGHTGGDAVVYFPADKVIALSDVITVGRAPRIDYAGGGSALGWIQALDRALELDWNVAIPGNGAPQTRAYVEEYRGKMQKLVDRARAAVRRGVAKDALMGEIQTDDLGWELPMTGAALDAFYEEMK